jgi:hypothetical protein
MNLAEALQDAINHAINTGTVAQLGEELGAAIRRTSIHPYIGRTGTLKRALYASVDGGKPQHIDVSGEIVFIGQDFHEDSAGIAPCPAVTIRLPNGDHITRHIDHLVLDEPAT